MNGYHARACQIFGEIQVLLEAGFAEGAMARWRTLHELCVAGQFIAKYGEEVAERYVLHQAVESKKAAEEYARCLPRLGYEPLDAEDVDAIQKSYDDVISRFGKDFKNSYGWAAKQLGNVDPKFVQLERDVADDHMRAHYRMASYSVHANPKGVFFRLGLLPDTPVLLAGPSNSGLVEPAQATARSLSLMTAVVCTLLPSLDHSVALRAVTQLIDEIGTAFAEVHQDLVDEEEALRSGRQQKT